MLRYLARLAGKLKYMDSRVDEQTRGITVRILSQNIKKIKPTILDEI
jgi:translation elongation factor EF-G